MLFSPQNQTQQIAHALSDLEVLELRKDLSGMSAVFAELGWDTANSPDFSAFLPHEEAALLSHAGYLLCYKGRSEGLSHYQERAKNLLTRSIELFESLGDVHAVSVTQIKLATAYGFEGSLDNSDTVHGMNAANDPSNPLYLAIQVHALPSLRRKSNSLALKKIEELEPLIDQSNDLKTIANFHDVTGITYRQAGDYTKAEIHHNQAVTCAREHGSAILEALFINSLAMTFLHSARYGDARRTADRSLHKLKELGASGWIPHILDTKAQIYFAQADYDAARTYIHEAITRFRNGDDYAGLADALWLQAKIFFKIEFREWGVDSYHEAIDIARTRLGARAVRRYQSDFLRTAYFVAGDNFDDKLLFFTRHLLEDIFKKTKSVTEAAEMLGFTNHQRLTALLQTKFPDLYSDLEIKTKRRREYHPPNVVDKITRITYSSDFKLPIEREGLSFYLVPAKFNLGRMITVRQQWGILEGQTVLYKENNTLQLGKLTFNGHWLVNNAGIETVECIGVVVAICRIPSNFELMN